MAFKYKREKDLFSWEDEFFKLEYSDPHIETFNGEVEISSEKAFMYYYYTLKVFKKSRNGRWKKITEVETFDFPGITSLRENILTLLDLDITIDGQKCYYKDGSIMYSYKADNLGFACEDYYELTKEMNSRIKKEIYSIFVGTCISVEADINFEGVKISNIYEPDLKELIDCINAFLDYSIKSYNDSMKEYVNLEINSKKVVAHKLYTYKIEDNKITDMIDYIYCIGDFLDVDYLESENKEVKKNNIEGKVVQITKDSIEIESLRGEKKTLDTDSLLFISSNVGEEKLKYKEEDIFKEFKSLMTSFDKNFFKNNSEEEIFRVYSDAIAGRSWMYRDEHEFPKTKKDERENVEEVIKSVITKLKSLS